MRRCTRCGGALKGRRKTHDECPSGAKPAEERTRIVSLTLYPPQVAWLDEQAALEERTRSQVVQRLVDDARED